MITELKNLNNSKTLTLFKDSTNICKDFVSIAEKLNENSAVHPNHWKEWVEGSGISPFVAALNLRSDADLLDRLLISEKLSRRNTGRVSDRYLKTYDHLYQGGWGSWGVDVLSPTGEESEWGVVKPNQPRKNKEGKIIKYEAPPKASTEIFAPKVSFLVSWYLLRDCGKSAQKAWSKRISGLLPVEEEISYNNCTIPTEILLQEDRLFYQYVISDSTIPIILAEGNKKAASLVSEGYIALSVPGVFNGYRKETKELIPQLKIFAAKEREWAICFDSDNKEKTIANVNIAIARTGRLLEKEGCKVSVIRWDHPEKGVDDLIVARGIEVFKTAYKYRFSLTEFETNKLLTLKSDLIQNERFIQNFDTKSIPIIGIKSPKGTGKTELLTQKVAQALENNQLALVMTHRIQLARTLCDRFGIDHIEEIKLTETGGVLGYGLCIDSVHPKSKARFNPEDWSGAIVILDEAEQVLWHTLNSNTCKYNRVAILETLTQLLQNVLETGGQIFLSDADLSAISIDYIKSLTGVKETFIVENLWEKDEKIPLRVYGGHDPREMLWDMIKDIEKGSKVFFQTSGQKVKSKWGTQNVEKYLRKKFKRRQKFEGRGQKVNCSDGDLNPNRTIQRIDDGDLNPKGISLKDNPSAICHLPSAFQGRSLVKKTHPNLKILRIDAESVADPNHPAFGCIKNLDYVLSQYDVILASPVIETGVSIDLKNYFDRVYCISYGIQTVDAVCQSLERVRDGVPRSLWAINKCPHYKIGNGATRVSSLMRSQDEQAKASISLLLQPEGEIELLGSASLLAWAKRACVNNSQRDYYRAAIVNKLLREGYELENSEFRIQNSRPRLDMLSNRKHPSRSEVSQELLDSNDSTDNDNTSQTSDFCLLPSDFSQELRSCRDEAYKQENEAIASANDSTNEHLEILKNKRRKTREERRQQRKAELSQNYGGVEVTPELVEKDDKGWLSQLKNHFFLTVGRDNLVDYDKSSLSRLFYGNNLSAFIPDINKTLYSAKIAALELLQIKQFLDPDAVFCASKLKDWLHMMIAHRWQIKQLFGVTINPRKDSAIAVAQRILKKLGLKLKAIGWHNRERIYGGTPIEDNREEIFSRWLFN